MTLTPRDIDDLKHIAENGSSEAKLLARIVLKEHDQLEEFRRTMEGHGPSGARESYHPMYGDPE